MRLALIRIVLLLGIIWIVAGALLGNIPEGDWGRDSHAYWLAGRSAQPYGRAPGSLDAFLYSPLFAQAMRPLALLPWPVFGVLWAVIEFGCFAWLVRPLPWPWRGVVFLAATPELIFGNVYGFYGLVLALGIRRPGLWAFPLLTKVTTAVPGFLWFATRREWRKLLVATTTSCALVTISALINPDMWLDWVKFLRANAGGGGMWVRLAIVACVVIVAALKGRPEWLPAAVLFLVPTWHGEAKDLALLVATTRARMAANSADVLPYSARPDSTEPLKNRVRASTDVRYDPLRFEAASDDDSPSVEV